ncbi:MAG: formylglycine-generating enzyme family protein [Candidatus Electrothrix sp. MAN1_4]|nr:formylglycine-generating enzyme family protein [Candidatus Electrothrix sp. MAN1_4]
MMHDRNHISPPQFPMPWAVDWGEDRYGLWMSFSLKGIRQTFRWIRPGSFLMGATKDEHGQRPWLGKETQHTVTLTQGVWLADTPVTQAMWRTVMHTSPSGFTGDLHPVTRISWQDTQAFLHHLHHRIPGLSARLPTEAEWEYACRAGSTTPFSLGSNISPKQVNYDGRYPYQPEQNKKDKEAGEYRKKTVTVKQLPCNIWGLFEMHGNVWEWCQDYWQDDLGGQPSVDPQGPKRGVYRTVRGGSWASDACFVRSACRDRYPPDYSFGSVGMRLVINAV